MNSRGQAALEYLMTYGWALIVIAIVVGVLVFIVATPTGGVGCNSNQPGKLNVVSNNIIDTSGLGSIVLTNLTAGTMTAQTVTASGAFAGATYTIDGNMTVGNHTLAITALSGAAGKTSGSFVFGYKDPAGLTQSATITCQNLKQ